MAIDGVKARYTNAINLVLAAPTDETRKTLTGLAWPGLAWLEPDFLAKISNCP